MNILIIPEDFSNDQYILKTVIHSAFPTLGRA